MYLLYILDGKKKSIVLYLPLPRSGYYHIVLFFYFIFLFYIYIFFYFTLYLKFGAIFIGSRIESLTTLSLDDYENEEDTDIWEKNRGWMTKAQTNTLVLLYSLNSKQNGVLSF